VVDINVDRLKENDIGPLAKWMADLPLMKRYEWSEYGLGRSLREALQQENLLLSAIFSGSNCPCGLAWIVPKGSFNRSPYLRLLVVHPRFTSIGVGAFLMLQVESQLNIDYKDLFLLVSDFNVDAQNFYRQMGYLKVGEIADYVVPGVSELIFRKSFKS
jgi:GNAT superfamily N-acetyltransferase